MPTRAASAGDHVLPIASKRRCRWEGTLHSLNMALCVDMQMNGLKLSNSWAGYLILLNPPYTAATQWRFVNRAIDEVENDQVGLCMSAYALLLLQDRTP